MLYKDLNVTVNILKEFINNSPGLFCPIVNITFRDVSGSLNDMSLALYNFVKIEGFSLMIV